VESVFAVVHLMSDDESEAEVTMSLNDAVVKVETSQSHVHKSSSSSVLNGDGNESCTDTLMTFCKYPYHSGNTTSNINANNRNNSKATKDSRLHPGLWPCILMSLSCHVRPTHVAKLSQAAVAAATEDSIHTQLLY